MVDLFARDWTFWPLVWHAAVIAAAGAALLFTTVVKEGKELFEITEAEAPGET